MVTKKNTKYSLDDVLEIEDIVKYLQISRPTVLRLLRNKNIVAGKLGGKWKALFKNVEEYRLRILEGGSIQRNFNLK